MLLALAYALLGRKADALREAARAAEILPVSRDAKTARTCRRTSRTSRRSSVNTTRRSSGLRTC